MKKRYNKTKNVNKSSKVNNNLDYGFYDMLGDIRNNYLKRDNIYRQNNSIYLNFQYPNDIISFDLNQWIIPNYNKNEMYYIVNEKIIKHFGMPINFTVSIEEKKDINKSETACLNV